MAIQVFAFQVTIPAGTAQASPFRQSTQLPERQVSTLEITVPPGPSGLMGFAITMGGVNVLPVSPGTFIVTDDERISWPLTGLPTSGAWQVSGYNTDVWPHTVYLRWLVDLVTQQPSSPLLSGVTLSGLSSP
jgi:hypothetical protein